MSKKETKKLPNLELKKPSLDEFLNNCKQMYLLYQNIFGAQYTLEKYLDVQRAYYRQVIEDLSQEDFEKLVKQTQDSVIKRFNKILDTGKDNAN